MSYDIQQFYNGAAAAVADWVARHSRFACCRCCLRHRGPVGCSVSLYAISGASRRAKFPGHRRAGKVASIAASPSCRTRPRRYSARSSWQRCRSVARSSACGTFVAVSILARALMKRLRLWREATAQRRLPNLPILMSRSPLDRAQPLSGAMPGCRDLGGVYRTRRVLQHSSARMTKFATLFHRRMTALGGNLPGPGRGREGLELALSTFRPCQTAALGRAAIRGTADSPLDHMSA